jgi:hypothetical protein
LSVVHFGLLGVVIGTSIQTAIFYSPCLGFLYGVASKVQGRLVIFLNSVRARLAGFNSLALNL